MIKNVFLNYLVVALAIALGASAVSAREDSVPRGARSAMQKITKDALPPEARNTLKLIERGGPFPYDRDGITFGNFEKRLPQKKRGYYQEFTVKTPGVRNRGARRIVAGGCSMDAKKSKRAPPLRVPCRKGERYFTHDHYKSFKRVMP